MDDACGPESLQFALRRDRRGADLEALAKLCSVRRDNGTLTSGMVAALATRGYKPWVEQDVTWERAAELLPKHHLFISWWTIFFPSGETGSGAGAHWSTITRLSERNVWIFDPIYERVVGYPKTTLDAFWVSPEMINGVLHDEIRLAVCAPRRPLTRKKPH